MTDTNVLSSVQVNTAVFYNADEVLDIARSIVAGDSRDYYFFQYDVDDYYLIIPTADYSYSSTGVFSCDSCEVYKITRNVTVTTSTQNLPFSGSENGTVLGIENGGAYHGSVSGNLTNTVYNTTVSYQTFYYDSSGVYVSNPNYYTVYGSFDNLPHLIEGVENYAFAGLLLFFGVCAFVLCDRLFKRFY